MDQELQAQNGYGNRPVWQYLLLYLIIGGVLYFLVYYFFYSKSGKSSSYSSQDVKSQTTETLSKNTVVYTNSGFNPKTLTVKAGTTVIFKNESTKPMWVASNPHPIHTDYSAFDAGKAYKNDSSYSFTFTEAKEYQYHNHLISNDEGLIIVQ